MKIAAFIPVRLSSSRLPSKALLDLSGKPCIQRLVERIKRVKGIELIVLCTTNNSTDDKIVKIAKEIDIEVFRGSEKDIIDRFYHAAIKFNVKKIVNIDGDDIFCEPKFIEETIRILSNDDIDFIIWENLPIGTTPIGIKFEALKNIWEIKDTKDTETGWGKFFTDTGLFNIKYLSPSKNEFSSSSIRLTLDYKEDYQLFKEIYNNLKEPFSLTDIIKLLDEKPELKKINNKLSETYKKNFEMNSATIKFKD
jgi:spore coat polysaccharide biosynthesis protein SpsF